MHDEYQVNFKQTYANTSCLLSTSFNISQYHAHTSGHNFWDIENMYSNRHRVTHLFSARLCRGRGAVKPNLDHDESNKERLQKVNSQSWNLIIWWNLMVFLIHVLNQEEEVRRLRIYHRNKLVPQPLEALFGEGDPLLQGCLIVGQPHTPAVAMGVIQNHLESGPVRENISMSSSFFIPKIWWSVFHALIVPSYAKNMYSVGLLNMAAMVTWKPQHGSNPDAKRPGRIWRQHQLLHTNSLRCRGRCHFLLRIKWTTDTVNLWAYRLAGYILIFLLGSEDLLRMENTSKSWTPFI